MKYEYTKDFINLIKISRFSCLMITFYNLWKGLGLLKSLLCYNWCFTWGFILTLMCLGVKYLYLCTEMSLSPSLGVIWWYGNSICHRYHSSVHVWASLVAPVHIYHCTDLKLRIWVIYLSCWVPQFPREVKYVSLPVSQKWRFMDVHQSHWEMN